MSDPTHVWGAIWGALLRLTPLPLSWRTSHRCVDLEVYRPMVQHLFEHSNWYSLVSGELNTQSRRVRVLVKVRLGQVRSG